MDLYDNDMSYDIVGVHVYIALTTMTGELLGSITHNLFYVESVMDSL